MHETPPFLHGTRREALRLYGAGAHAARRGQDFPPHQHSTWEVTYYRAGHIRCAMGADVYNVGPGTVLINPPAVIHSERADTAYANYFIVVDAPPDHPWPRRCHDDDLALGPLCGALVREWHSHAPERDRMLAALLTQLDIRLLRAHERPHLSPAESLVRDAERLLEERFAGTVRIGDIARDIGVSPSVLRAHFARLRGRTPLAHLHAVRVRHALALLGASDLTLEAIATLCGYDSASHLSRHVKRATGRNPGALRGAAEV